MQRKGGKSVIGTDVGAKCVRDFKELFIHSMATEQYTLRLHMHCLIAFELFQCVIFCLCLLLEEIRAPQQLALFYPKRKKFSITAVRDVCRSRLSYSNHSITWKWIQFFSETSNDGASCVKNTSQLIVEHFRYSHSRFAMECFLASLLRISHTYLLELLYLLWTF